MRALRVRAHLLGPSPPFTLAPPSAAAGRAEWCSTWTCDHTECAACSSALCVRPPPTPPSPPSSPSPPPLALARRRRAAVASPRAFAAATAARRRSARRAVPGRAFGVVKRHDTARASLRRRCVRLARHAPRACGPDSARARTTEGRPAASAASSRSFISMRVHKEDLRLHSRPGLRAREGVTSRAQSLPRKFVTRTLSWREAVRREGSHAEAAALHARDRWHVRRRPEGTLVRHRWRPVPSSIVCVERRSRRPSRSSVPFARGFGRRRARRTCGARSSRRRRRTTRSPTSTRRRRPPSKLCALPSGSSRRRRPSEPSTRCCMVFSVQD